MAKPTLETAKVVKAEDVEIGDEIYCHGSLRRMGDHWRTVVAIKVARKDSKKLDFYLVLERFAGKPKSFDKACYNDSLIIVRKKPPVT